MINNILKRLKQNWPIFVAVFVMAFMIGYFSHGQPSDGDKQEVMDRADDTAAVWTCSMHPQVRQPEPGLCPICAMELIPVEQENGTELGAAQLKLSPTAVALSEIETSVVERKWIPHEIRLYGKVAVDESRFKTITAWVSGRIDRLYVDYTGAAVETGQPLVRLYSPELFVEQQAYLQALASAERPYLQTETIRKKLQWWGLSDEQIANLQQAKKADPFMTIPAPIGGVVLKKKALKGDYVDIGTALYEIADLSRVWINLNAYETDLAFLKTGQTVSVELKAYAGELFKGRIEFIHPVLNDKSRTIQVRVSAENRQQRLKPGLLVTATVRIEQAPGGQPPLMIPVSAPLITGERAVVYVADASQQGLYSVRNVVLGQRTNDHYVVVRGLAAGERVVTHGAFKIDSEMQIRAKTSMMNPPAAKAGDEHDQMLHTASAPRHQHQHSEKSQAHVEKPHSSTPRRFKGTMPAGFYTRLKATIERYYSVQQALSQDDFKTAKGAAAKLRKRLHAFDSRYENEWSSMHKSLVAAAVALAEANHINAGRKAFERFSDALIKVVNRYGAPSGMLVEQYHCPMAFDDKGADWLSNAGEVENPYYGSQMFRCGSKVNSLGATSEPGAKNE